MPRTAKGLNRNAGEVCRGPWKASCYITSTDGVNKMEMASFDMIGDEGKGGIQVDSNRTSPSVAQNTCLTTVLIPYCFPRQGSDISRYLSPRYAHGHLLRQLLDHGRRTLADSPIALIFT